MMTRNEMSVKRLNDDVETAGFLFSGKCIKYTSGGSKLTVVVRNGEFSRTWRSFEWKKVFFKDEKVHQILAKSAILHGNETRC